MTPKRLGQLRRGVLEKKAIKRIIHRAERNHEDPPRMAMAETWTYEAWTNLAWLLFDHAEEILAMYEQRDSKGGKPMS